MQGLLEEIFAERQRDKAQEDACTRAQESILTYNSKLFEIGNKNQHKLLSKLSVCNCNRS